MIKIEIDGIEHDIDINKSVKINNKDYLITLIAKSGPDLTVEFRDKIFVTNTWKYQS